MMCHDALSDLPLAPENGVPPNGSNEKLLLTLAPWKNYVIHWETLRQYFMNVAKLDCSSWFASPEYLYRGSAALPDCVVLAVLVAGFFVSGGWLMSVGLRNTLDVEAVERLACVGLTGPTDVQRDVLSS
ncbi:hypothetical protein PR048_009695 [Dryococelus australis]|uniref:Uncharacterized protein n=1 Tax=Dryococelus australis TaxID=614101 RepID=A0ABQ9I0L7_9NEOP|nr:hypothetical protein PR048_009695 [Dryococelus australis]